MSLITRDWTIFRQHNFQTSTFSRPHDRIDRSRHCGRQLRDHQQFQPWGQKKRRKNRKKVGYALLSRKKGKKSRGSPLCSSQEGLIQRIYFISIYETIYRNCTFNMHLLYLPPSVSRSVVRSIQYDHRVEGKNSTEAIYLQRCQPDRGNTLQCNP